LGARKKNGSDFAGCKKSPVTVTREGGVSAPDWRREDAMPRRGRSARRRVRERGKGTRVNRVRERGRRRRSEESPCE